MKPSSSNIELSPKHVRAARALLAWSQQDLARNAYRLFNLWDLLPGTGEDGTVDSNALKAWITEARSLAKTVGRVDIADRRIGAMLSASPNGTDGIWPAEAVREVLDSSCSQPMFEDFWVGRRNRRGITCRRPRDGGTLERNEAVASPPPSLLNTLLPPGLSTVSPTVTRRTGVATTKAPSGSIGNLSEIQHTTATKDLPVVCCLETHPASVSNERFGTERITLPRLLRFQTGPDPLRAPARYTHGRPEPFTRPVISRISFPPGTSRSP